METGQMQTNRGNPQMSCLDHEKTRDVARVIGQTDGFKDA